MQVEDKAYVAIDYKLTLDNGEEIDKSPEGQPLGFIVGVGQIIPGLEKELMGKTTGDSLQVTVEPEEGYGQSREDLIQELPKSQFPDDVEVKPGMTFQAQGPNGPMMINVVEVQDENVKVDLNHPLAGKRLQFDVTINEVRQPTDAEMSEVSQGCASGGCASGCSC